MEKQTNLTRETQQRKRAEPLPTPPSDSPSTVMVLIERVARDQSAAVEKLECLAAMYERLKAKEAELAFNAAKGRILQKARRHQNRQEPTGSARERQWQVAKGRL